MSTNFLQFFFFKFKKFRTHLQTPQKICLIVNLYQCHKAKKKKP